MWSLKLRSLICFLSIFLILLISSGCKEESEVQESFERGYVTETSKNFKFPAPLKDIIEDEYVAFMKTQGPPFDIKTKEELLLQLPREYLDLTVTLRPLASGTLSDPTIFSLPRGGGGIDLKDYVRGAKGSFFVTGTATKTVSPEQAPAKLKIYFLSQAKKRKIGDEKFGAGCDRYMDITNYWLGKSGEGIQVNATDQRYVSVLAGTYYFVGFESEKIFLASLKIYDSRYPSLQCL